NVKTIIAQLRYGNYLTKAYPKKAFELHDKYRPIEIDPKIPKAEKLLKMEEWWSTHITLIAKSGMTKSLITKINNDKNIQLREGAREFFKILANKKVPLLIMSAALGDLIDEMLKQESALTPNIQVISNYFDFDANGNVKGYKGKIIHALNKNEFEIINTPHYDSIKDRHNILLLDDSFYDLDMVEGIKYKTLISIAFLSPETEKDIEHFKKKYNVIVLNDGNMGFVNSLLTDIN
ncbi:MAG: hypothetical protein NTY48_01865, partial [Candidatus Diapherotrites archaeon]|nr:hypothetical protein [Candidatus Diapherotrites archaeon]